MTGRDVAGRRVWLAEALRPLRGLQDQHGANRPSRTTGSSRGGKPVVLPPYVERRAYSVGCTQSSMSLNGIAKENPLRCSVMVGQQVTGERGNSLTVVEEIGRGAFGVVYLAEDTQGGQYALKVIAPASDSEARLSFEREVQGTLDLDHENILKILDYGTRGVGTNDCLFVASEYCPDGTYRDVLSQYAANTTTFDGIVDDMRQVVHGLRVLHGKMIHRDLKPENVFISGDKLKIGDFGLSKFVDQATRSLTFKGSGTPIEIRII